MSTYLIDCSKKCYLGKEESLMGDISESSLQGLGLCFKENFMAANDQLKKDFDKLTKPIKTMVQGILSAIPILKGIDIQNGSIRDTLINGYVLLSTFLGKDTTTTTLALDKWNQIYLKNYPLRKGPPVIGLKSGGITIEFAYGKANMFDAYYEVFQPLQALQSYLFPSFTSTGSLANSGIKYVQQSFPAVVNAFAQDAIAGLTTLTTASKNLNSATKAIKKTLNNKKVKISAKAAIKSAAGKLTYGEWSTEKANLAKLVGAAVVEGSTGFDNSAFTALSTMIPNLNPEELFSQDSGGFSINLSSLGGDDKNGEETESSTDKISDDTKLNTSKLMELIEEDLDDAIDGAYEDGFSLTYSSNGFTASAIEGELSSGQDFGSIFNTIITLENSTITNAMESLEPTGYKTFSLGFPSIYYTSQAKVNEFCKSNNARIQYKGVIVEAASVTFDYSRVDEAGYPMAGKLVIERLWNVNTPNGTLEFNSGDGSAYGKNTLPVVNDSF